MVRIVCRIYFVGQWDKCLGWQQQQRVPVGMRTISSSRCVCVDMCMRICVDIYAVYAVYGVATTFPPFSSLGTIGQRAGRLYVDYMLRYVDRMLAGCRPFTDNDVTGPTDITRAVRRASPGLDTPLQRERRAGTM